jgi:hypothetical protein
MELNATAEQRFWAKVKKTRSHWLWTGAVGRDGYGNFWGGPRWLRAHRVSYFLEHGWIDESLPIDHICKTTLCVKPVHLRITSWRENTVSANSMSGRYARRTLCKNGHPLTPTNYKPPRRVCLVCRRSGRTRARRLKALSQS